MRTVCILSFCFFLNAQAKAQLILKDIFNRNLNNQTIILTDWEGYIANPAVRLILKAPATTRFPLTVTLKANGALLYFDMPSTTSASGPEKTIKLKNANPVSFYISDFPDRDTIVMTDPDRWDSYNPATNSFRINSGESNIITRVMGYYRVAVLIFFQRGIHILENFTNPASGTTGDQRQINNFLGSVSSMAQAQIGVDVYFLSEPGRGVYRISEAVQDQIAVNPLAVSDPIQSVINAVDWTSIPIKYAIVRTLGIYVYVGLSIGVGPTANNVMGVFNQYTRQWESIDVFNDPNFFFNEMHVISCAGQRQLVAVDWARKRVYGMYFAMVDNRRTPIPPPGPPLQDPTTLNVDQIGVAGAQVTIIDIIETRGYTLHDPNAFKRFERVNIGLQTYEPSFLISSISDGHNEIKKLTDTYVTKNALRYYIHGHKFYNSLVDDPNAPKREDYFDSRTPFDVEKQQTIERYQIRQNGRWASIQVVNNQGNCDVSSINVEGFPIQEGIRTLA